MTEPTHVDGDHLWLRFPGARPPRATFLLTAAQIHGREELSRIVTAIGDNSGSYHELHLTPDLCVQGDYDMRRYVDYYGIADDLRGQRVLDVGTSTGYFALECARRGAAVVAMDIWDSTPLSEIARCTALDIRYVKKNLYDLDAAFGQFDTVICGSLLLHLPDTFRAVAALRQVCAGRLHVSTACTKDSGLTEFPRCDFVATRNPDATYYNFWHVSAAALRNMLLVAGFGRVDHIDHFALATTAGRAEAWSTPHVVAIADV